MFTLCYLTITKSLHTTLLSLCKDIYLISKHLDKERETDMHKKLKIIILSTTILLSGLTGCSNSDVRITPGTLKVSKQVEIHTAKINNIIQLSDKEAPDDKILGGILTGALIGAAITNDASNDAKELGVTIGAILGENVVMNKHGRTIYRLSLLLDDGTQKEVYVRGGHYHIGRMTKVTVHKESGEITSFKLANT